MKSIRETLTAIGLGRIANQVESAVKQSALLVATDRSEDATTRLGGMPNLPSEIEWPRWKGKPLAFVAQIDLAALPIIENLCLPRNGALFFFYDGESGGFQPGDRGSFCVFYSAAPLTQFRPRPFPSDLPSELYFTGLQLIVGSPELSLPGWEDTVVNEAGLSAEERHAYSDFREQWIGLGTGQV
jgi:hypothetical protein